MAAFKSIVNGAECSGSNPLAQLSKTFTADKSLQRDGFAPSRQGGEQRPHQGRVFGSQGQSQVPHSAEDRAMADQFFNDPQSERTAQPFKFAEMRNGLETVHPRAKHNDWSKEFHNDASGIYEIPANSEWDDIYKMTGKGKGPAAHHWQEEFLQAKGLMPDQHPAELEEAFNRGFNWEEQFALAEGSHDVPLKTNAHGMHGDEAWEREFAKVNELDDPTMTDAFDRPSDGLEASGFADFENVWNSIKKGEGAEDATWEDEFANGAGANAFDATDGRYVFETENSFLGHPDPFAEGLRLMENAAPLSQAALAFEAACQKDSNSSVAWAKLGTVQAENEKEEAAIKALERAVMIDESNSEALMALAVSYINEGHDHKAYHSLENWLKVQYPNIVSSARSNPAELELSGIPTYDKHLQVQDLFLRAARETDGVSNKLDPNVQIGLGVLFYGSAEYDKAVDCFVAALQDKPTDYILFNRLGATLANSGRSEEAIDAYHRALDIKPSFVRARYNLGVSCINIGVLKEAVEHFLAALAMHQQGKSPSEVNISDNLWDTLRRTFVMMDRRDLADKIRPGMDVSEFRNEFDFE